MLFFAGSPEVGPRVSVPRETHMSLRIATCLAILAVAGCGIRSFVTPTSDGTFVLAGSSAHLKTGAEEKARLVADADAYCKRRGTSAVVIASSEIDAKPGTLAAPGNITHATVEFRCQ